MLHVCFHLKTFVNDNQVNDRLTLVVILKYSFSTLLLTGAFEFHKHILLLSIYLSVAQPSTSH